jgi:hypothetical protein
MRYTLLTAALLAGLSPAAADGPGTPRPVPLTRPEVKRALEDLKKANPRLPLPPMTEEQKKEWGDRPVVNNAFARFLYLPRELRGGDFVRAADPAMSLDPTFKTMLFWIVSRANNCHY